MVKRLKATNEEKSRSKKVRDEIPPVNEQLDAIWDTLDQMEKPLPKVGRDMLARIDAVKQKYPKKS